MSEIDLDILKINTYKKVIASRRLFAYEYKLDKTFPFAGAMVNEPKKDPYMIINPSFIKSSTDGIFLLGHELLHDLLEHVPRMINLLGEKPADNQFVLWNLAVDHVVNKILTSLQYSTSDSVGLSFSSSDLYNHRVDLNEQYPNAGLDDKSAEEIYRFLVDNTVCETSIISIDGDGQGENDKDSSQQAQGSGSVKKDQKKDQSSDSADKTDEADSGECKQDCDPEGQRSESGKDGQGNQNSSNTSYKIIKSTIKDKKSGKILHEEYKVIKPNFQKFGENQKRIKADGAFELQEAFKGAGNVPGCLEKELDMIKNPLDLRAHLEHYLSTIKEGAEDITFSKPSKLNLVFSDLYLVIPKYVRKTVKCIIGIDTSGSIEDREFQEFISILYGNSEWLDMVIYFCDVEIQKEINFRDFSVDEVKSMFIELKNRPGYGGTSFTPVFEKAEQETDLDFIIYFTDLEPFEWPKEPNTRVLWIARKSYQSIKPPFGKVVWY